MSASTERAARRDLRRIVGAGAVPIIEAQSGALVEHRKAIDKLLVVADAHESRLHLLGDGRIADTEARLAFEHMTLWQRLRWLVRGR